MDFHCDTISFCQAFKKFSMRSRLLHTPVETNGKEKLANADRSGKGRYGAHGTKGESKNGPRVLVSRRLASVADLWMLTRVTQGNRISMKL
jgi:hypothetical protein